MSARACVGLRPTVHLRRVQSGNGGSARADRRVAERPRHLLAVRIPRCENRRSRTLFECQECGWAGREDHIACRNLAALGNESYWAA